MDARKRSRKFSRPDKRILRKIHQAEMPSSGRIRADIRTAAGRKPAAGKPARLTIHSCNSGHVANFQLRTGGNFKLPKFTRDAQPHERSCSRHKKTGYPKVSGRAARSASAYGKPIAAKAHTTPKEGTKETPPPNAPQRRYTTARRPYPRHQYTCGNRYKTPRR